MASFNVRSRPRPSANAARTPSPIARCPERSPHCRSRARRRRDRALRCAAVRMSAHARRSVRQRAVVRATTACPPAPRSPLSASPGDQEFPPGILQRLLTNLARGHRLTMSRERRPAGCRSGNTVAHKIHEAEVFQVAARRTDPRLGESRVPPGYRWRGCNAARGWPEVLQLHLASPTQPIHGAGNCSIVAIRSSWLRATPGGK